MGWASLLLRRIVLAVCCWTPFEVFLQRPASLILLHKPVVVLKLNPLPLLGNGLHHFKRQQFSHYSGPMSWFTSNHGNSILHNKACVNTFGLLHESVLHQP